MEAQYRVDQNQWRLGMTVGCVVLYQCASAGTLLITFHFRLECRVTDAQFHFAHFLSLAKRLVLITPIFCITSLKTLSSVTIIETNMTITASKQNNGIIKP